MGREAETALEDGPFETVGFCKADDFDVAKCWLALDVAALSGLEDLEDGAALKEELDFERTLDLTFTEADLVVADFFCAETS